MKAGGLFLALLALPLHAEARPRSAIPWLSDSVAAAAAAPAVEPRPLGPSGGGFEISRLDAPPIDGLGLLSPEESGFPPALWGATSALRARALIARQPEGGVPAARTLFGRLLLAETDPPPGATEGGDLLIARIDRLIADARLQDARALIERAGTDRPALFRRAFDIGLLTDETAPLCNALVGSPSLTPTLPARVFCRARAGDWDAAALTLALGVDLGQIDPTMEETLARFLDPGLFEGEADPPVPDPLTPLHFVLRDAVGLELPGTGLPLAFAHHDLPDHTPLRDRIAAAERLVRAGAVEPAFLLGLYRSNRPAASGGVWTRAEHLRRLDAALAVGEAGDIATAAKAADAAFVAADLRAVLAAAVARYGAETRVKLIAAAASLKEPCRTSLADLMLLAGLPGAATRLTDPYPTAADRLHRALATGDPLADTLPDPLAASEGLPELERAVVAGLTRTDPPGADAAGIAARITAGRFGEALLETLALLSPGTEIDPGDLEAALFLLRRLGLEADARRIALETLVLRPFG